MAAASIMGESTIPKSRRRARAQAGGGHVGAGPDGLTDVGLGEGRSVVDPVAHHGDAPSLVLQASHFGPLILLAHLSRHPVDPDSSGDGLGDALRPR